MNERQYTADYIKRSQTAETLEAPDRVRSGDHHETLSTIHDSHTKGGPAGATAAWGAMKRLAPELAQLEQAESDLIHADELGTIPIPMYLLTSYPVYSVGFNVLIGESGVGKSFIALDIAGRIATKAAVVYIAGEGLAGYAARWYAWKDYHHITDPTHLYFYRKALQVMEMTELEVFMALIAEHKPSLVIIDTLARSAVGVDENSAKEMGEFIAACDHIRNGLNCAVLVVHHTGKNGDIRGSSSLYGAADSLMLAKHDDGFIRLINDNARKGKNKYSEAFDDKTFTIASHLGTGPDGITYEGAVLKSIDLVNIEEGAGLPESQQKMLEFIASFGDDGIDVKGVTAGTELAQSTVYRNLGKFVADGLLEKHSGIYSITDTGKNLI